LTSAALATPACDNRIVAAIPAAASLIRFFMTLALDYLKDHKPQWKLRATLQNVKLMVPTTKASVEKNLIIADG
jgi:hypothetical protein